MANRKYFILMGDIAGSRKYDGKMLMEDFRRLVSSCNTNLASRILSPYTITLGDEFQGVARSLRSGLESIFYFEEASLGRRLHFKLRYVLYHGIIETRLNRQTAYEMLGPGLAKAREMLSTKRRQRPRFLFDLAHPVLTRQLCRLFSVLDTLIGEWREDDYLLISDMLANDNNEEVGAKYGKNRSQIWKRRKHLHITEYKMLKEVIFDLAEPQ